MCSRRRIGIDAIGGSDTSATSAGITNTGNATSSSAGSSSSSSCGTDGSDSDSGSGRECCCGSRDGMTIADEVDEMMSILDDTSDDIRDELTALALRAERELERADRLARELVFDYGYPLEQARTKALASVYLDRYRDQIRADAVLAEIEIGGTYRG